MRLITLLLCLIPAFSDADPRFGFDHVSELARKLASDAYRSPQPVSEFLKSISYDDYRDIRFDPKQSLWRDRGNFQVQFIHLRLFY